MVIFFKKIVECAHVVHLAKIWPNNIDCCRYSQIMETSKECFRTFKVNFLPIIFVRVILTKLEID